MYYTKSNSRTCKKIKKKRFLLNKLKFQVTWSRVNFVNDTQKLTYLLYVDLLKYTPFSRYHLTHLIEKDDREYWNLEIRQVHLADQGYYSCVLTGVKPISKLFYVKVIGKYSFFFQIEKRSYYILENTRNLPFALRSTSNMQRLGKDQINSSLSLIEISIFKIILMIIIILFI